MKLCLFAASLLVAAPVFSAESDLESGVTELDPIVVTSTGNETRLSRTLASTTVISRDQIERAQALDLAELLRFNAGVEIGRNGGAGAVTSVFVRGGESNHTLILVDGVRINPASSGGAALQNIAPDSIERIEIVKGPRSAIYGSDAIAATINIITRNATGSRVEGWLRGGAFDTREASVRLAHGNTENGLNIQAQRFETEGYSIQPGGSVDAAGNERTSVSVNGNGRFGKNTMRLKLWQSRGETDYDPSFPPFFIAPLASQDFVNRVIGVTVDRSLSPKWSLSLNSDWMSDDIQQNQSSDFVTTDRSQLGARIVGDLKKHRLSFAATAARENVDADGFGTAYQDSRGIYSISAQDEINMGSHSAVIGVSANDHDAFGNRIEGSLEYGFRLKSGAQLFASGATGFRAPDATDQFGFGGNPDLKPEAAINYELGARKIAGAHSVDLRVFHAQVDDLISVEFDVANNPAVDFGFRAVNVDEYENTGVELSYGWLNAGLSANISGIIQNPEDKSTGQQLARRAKRSISGNLAYRFSRYFVGLDLLGSSERPDPNGTLPGYALANLTAGADINQNWKISARVENILDTEYQTAGGFDMAGAAAYLTLKYRR